METASGPQDEGPGSGPAPPPSPLSGAYLLILVGEPHTDAHKQDILRKIANGFLSWDMESCHVALDKELQAIISQAPEGEEARNGERLIQFASENLVTEVLIHPQLNTLIQCVRNLLSSFTKHRHIIHAGYTFAGNGSWIVQDGTFSLADLIDAFQEPEVQRVLRAYENSVTVDIHCAPEGEWSTARLRKEGFTKLCRVRVNPDDSPSPAANIQQFVDYLAPFIHTAPMEQLLEPSDVVGNIRFSHPTLYVFPGGQGDAALFGINGFNMLVDGGFARKACFWDFARHLDRLDAVLLTRLNNSNVAGVASVLRRKRLSHVYPQIGHFFCNLQDRKQPSTPDEEKVRDPLLVSLLDEGQEMVHNLRHLQLKPHKCVRDSVLEPINLYHKVGHGKLDMYVISPNKDSKELKEFLSKWHSSDISLFSSVSKRPGDKDISFPLQNLVSICALLVWQPANPDDTITRLLFPGSTPQHKIFEGLEKLRSLEFMRQPVCTAKALSPSSSTLGISTKISKVKSTPAVIDKLLPGEGLTKPIPKSISQTESTPKQMIAKTATIPVSGAAEPKQKTVQPQTLKSSKPKQEKIKQEKESNIDKNVESETEVSLKQDKPSIISEHVKESNKIKTDKPKHEGKPKKAEGKITSKGSERKTQKSSSIEKKDSVKSSPTTPKKSVEAKMNGVVTKPEIIKTAPRFPIKTRSPSATPAKSTKEENNRKVVESKVKAEIASRPYTTGKYPKKDENVIKSKPEKRVSKKPTSASPIKGSSKSPVKAPSKTTSKPKKDTKIVKGETEKAIVTDSSTVSTPSTVDAELAIAKEGKLDEKEQTNINNETDVAVKQVVENENITEDISKDIDETVEAKEKTEEASVSEDVGSTDKLEEKPVDISEREFSEKEEEDEILIIEKVEIEQYGDDSIHDQESLESHIPDEVEDEIQKHLRDEAESEKRKDETITIDDAQDKVEEISVELLKDSQPEVVEHELNEKEDIAEEHESIVPSNLALNLDKEVTQDKVLTPENREQIEEEVQEIITSATDFVAKTKLEQSKENSELSAEGVGSDEQKTSGEIKDLPSSQEKLQILSDKNFTDDENKQDTSKDKSKEQGEGKYGAEESQPDEKLSTTVESGATTAPTLPEDERIPLDEIKEGVEEKYDKEDTKEKDTGIAYGRVEQPTTLPQVSVIPGGSFETHSTHVLIRDIVKTPDEVADLPVHEEVDGVYEDDEFSREGSKSKEDLLSLSIGKKDVDKKEDDAKDQKSENPVVDLKVDSVISMHQISDDKPQVQVPKDVKSEEEKPHLQEGELPKDAKSEEDELKQLKNITLRLEEEDVLQLNESTVIGAVLKESESENSKLTGKVNPPDSILLDKEISYSREQVLIVEEEPIHSMLKAPEVAELVLVTPDSAPESPLHQIPKPLEGKDTVDEVPQPEICASGADILVVDSTKQEIMSHVEDNEPIVGEDKDVPDEQIDKRLLEKSKEDNKSDEIIPKEESILISSALGEKQIETKEIEKVLTQFGSGDTLEIIKEPKGQVDTPKTPPASPIIGDMEKVTDTFQVIDEVNELVDKQETGITETVSVKLSTAVKSGILEEIVEEGSKELVPDVLCLDKGVEIAESEERTDTTIKPHGDIDYLKESIPDKTDIPCKPVGESDVPSTEQIYDSKNKSPDRLSPIQHEKAQTEVTDIADKDKDITSKAGGLEPSEHMPLDNQEKEDVIKDVHSKSSERDGIETEIEISAKTSSTPKSISPVLSKEEDKEDTTDKIASDVKHSPKSISPAPSEKEDIIQSEGLEKEIVDTSTITRPLESGDEECKLEREVIGEPKNKSPSTASPKSTSPVPKLKEETESDPTKVMIPREGQDVDDDKHIEGDAVINTASIPCDEFDRQTIQWDSNKKGEGDKSESFKTEDKFEIEVQEEKKDSPKSLSPVPSDKSGEKTSGVDLDEKRDSSKSSSPIPIQIISDDKKEDATKSASPVPAVHQLGEETSGMDSEEKRDSSKSSSPIPIQVISDDNKEDTTKSVSPVLSDKITEKLDEDRRDSHKPASPVPSLKDLEKTEDEKRDSIKSISPISSEREMMRTIEKSEDDKRDSLVSISPIPSEKDEPKDVLKGKEDKDDGFKSVSPDISKNSDLGIVQQQVQKEKLDTSKSSSPVPSEKDELVTDAINFETKISDSNVSKDECLEADILIPPKDVESGASNEMEKNDFESVVVTSIEGQLNIPKRFSPAPNEKNDQTLDDKQHASPLSVSPVPSEKDDNKDCEKLTQSADQSIKEHTPKSASPAPSDKCSKTGDTPQLSGGVSPVADKEDTEEHTNVCKKIDDGVENISVLSSVASVPSDHIDTPKSVSPVPSQKSDIPDLDDKRDTPKSASPAFSDKTDPTVITTVTEAGTKKHDSPRQSIQDSGSKPTVKEDTSQLECQEPVPEIKSLDQDDNLVSNSLTAEKQSSDEEGKLLDRSSPVLSEKEDIKHTDKDEANILEDDILLSSKIVSTVQTLKEGDLSTDKSLPGSHGVSKSPSPIPEDIVQQKDEKGLLDADGQITLKEEMTSPTSVSPTPSDKSSEKVETILESNVSKSKTATTEKADTEISEKEKLKSTFGDEEVHAEKNKEESNEDMPSVLKDASQVSKDHVAVDGSLGETILPASSTSPAPETKTTESGSVTKESIQPDLSAEIQEKGMLESFQSEKDSCNGSKVIKPHVSSPDSSKKVPDSIPKLDGDKSVGISGPSVPSEDSSHSSGSLEKVTPELCDSKVTSSPVRDETPSLTNGHSSIADDTKNIETSAVIKKTLECKDEKTADSVKSESVVPSTDVSSSVQPVVKSSKSDDCDSKHVTEHSKSDVVPPELKGNEITFKAEKAEDTQNLNEKCQQESKSNDINLDQEPPKSSNEVSFTIHRMLVTGSSEDGGMEAELCTSSVTRISGDKYDKHLGNIVHQMASDELKEESTTASIDLPKPELREENTSTPLVSELPTTEKTIITTTHPVNGKQLSEDEESAIVKTTTTTITKTPGEPPITDVKVSEEYVAQTSPEKIQSITQDSAQASETSKLSSTVSQTLKKEVSEPGRSGTPASDMASEREFETGGPSTPHSDISSGQVSRAATHVWGESSEGRPDSRHGDSDDDIPCSPMSATSHMAQSPPQFDFDIHQHAKGALYEETTALKDPSIPSAMTSSLYGSLPEEDPLEAYMREKKQLPGESEMYSSMYVSKYEDDDDEPLKQSPAPGKGQLESMYTSKKDDIDFETAVKEHRSVRGEDITSKFTTSVNGKSDVNGKSSYSECSTNGFGKQPHLNGKSSQPDSLEYQDPQPDSSIPSSQKSVPSQVLPPEVPSSVSSSSSKPSEEKKDPIEGWGKPLGLPPPPKNLIDSSLSKSTLTLVWNPAEEWGIPLGLPSPAPPTIKKDSLNGEIDPEITSTSNKTTPKKVVRKNAENNKSASNVLIGKEASNKSKHPESPVKRASNKESRSKAVTPVYMDLTYVPHHGNSHYTTVEFFKRIRARYYVFSGTEPSREVFNALLEAKQTWEDKDLEVTIIPTYDTDTLGYWVAENEELLAKYKIDLSPSASRCTINLQDHETSCSAYRLEF